MVKPPFVLWFAAAVFWATPAFAQQQDPREIQARKDCLTGNYQSGVALLAELFAETGNTNFVYNQARCYEQNARPEDAINRFREYLRVARNLSVEEKTDVDQHIAECRTLQAEQEKKAATAATVTSPGPPPAPVLAEPPPAPAATPPVVQAAPVPAPVVPAPVAVAELPASPASTSPGKGLRIAGIACGAVGLASIGTAIYYYTRATSLSDKVTNAAAASSSDYQAGKDAETMQWVFYSVGAGAVATGVVLYALGWSASTEPARVGVAPILRPGIAGVSAQGAF